MKQEKTLGERIRAERENLGLTQKELGERTRIDHNSISRYELDESQPSLNKLKTLAEVFHCSLDYLVYGTPKGYPPSLQFALRGFSNQEQAKIFKFLTAILDFARSLK